MLTKEGVLLLELMKLAPQFADKNFILWFIPRLENLRVFFSSSFLHRNKGEYIQHSYTLEFSECLSHTFACVSLV